MTHPHSFNWCMETCPTDTFLLATAKHWWLLNPGSDFPQQTHSSGFSWGHGSGWQWRGHCQRPSCSSCTGGFLSCALMPWRKTEIYYTDYHWCQKTISRIYNLALELSMPSASYCVWSTASAACSFVLIWRNPALFQPGFIFLVQDSHFNFYQEACEHRRSDMFPYLKKQFAIGVSQKCRQVTLEKVAQVLLAWRTR